MKNKFLVIIGVIITILLILNNLGKGSLKNISEQDRAELMRVLKIEKSSTFLPIQIEKNDCGIGDTTLKYTLEFEISKEEYEANKLKYSDSEPAEVCANWKETKDENTYVCYVRDNEWTSELRKELFEKIRYLYNKY